MKREILIALGVLAVVALFAPILNPNTSWLATWHLRAAVGVAPVETLFGTPAERAGQNKEIVKANPRDFQLAFGAALEACDSQEPKDPGSESEATVEPLRALLTEHPERPELLAALLRQSTRSFRVGRDDEQRIAEGRAPTPSARPAHPQPSVAAWKIFDDAAARGEKLDPGNAYFPAMRAAAHLAVRRDTDAWNALERAGRCKFWREYIPDEVVARERIARERGDMRGSLALTARWAAILLPHYAQLRAMARLGLGEAVRRETTGAPRDGIRLRTDLQTIGGLMRNQGTSLIANLVGVAIDSLARSRPGGKPNPKPEPDRTAEQVAADTRKRYADYGTWAEANGVQGAARMAKEAADDHLAVKDVANKGLERSPTDWSKLRIAALELLAGAGLVANAIWIAFVGLVSWALARWSPIARGGKLPLPAVLLTMALTTTAIGASALFTATRLRPMITSFSPSNSGEPASMSGGSTELVIAVLIHLAGVVLITAGVALRTLLQPKSSLSRGMVLGWRAACVPATAVALLAWAGFTVWSGSRDAERLLGVRQMVLHEGRTLAALAGLRWPGEFSNQFMTPE